MNETSKEIMSGYVSAVEQTLKKYSLTPRLIQQASVGKAMDYSLEAGGKRIRPVLVQAFCDLCGGNAKNVLSAAAAIEMIHTFSLIHDDLPCMDDDDLRRGKPSCHKKFGEACAVLAGDALAVYPFEVISSDESLAPEIRVKLINELASSTGAEGMIGGQIIDMENEARDDISEQELIFMYSLKTGKLIKTACVMGCIAAGASDEQVKLAKEYAECLGLAFQIVDDILDVTADEKKLGKPTGSDSEENKTTFVDLLGLDGAKKKAAELTEKSLEILDRFENSGFLKELTEYLLVRDH